MPYKEKINYQPKSRQKKPSYKVLNWSDYNRSLKKRGAISLYFPKGDLVTNFINEQPYVRGISGKQVIYKPAFIELMYTFYRLFGWGMRQITGYVEDLWQSKKLAIPVPSFGHLSDLFASLPIKTKQCCDVLSKRIKDGEYIALIVDSSSMKFDQASHWYQKKYHKPSDRRPWRKMHIAIDPEMNMHGLKITEETTADIHEVVNLLV